MGQLKEEATLSLKDLNQAGKTATKHQAIIFFIYLFLYFLLHEQIAADIREERTQKVGKVGIWASLSDTESDSRYGGGKDLDGRRSYFRHGYVSSCATAR